MYFLKTLKFKTVMSENASSRNSISWNWFCQGLVHTVPQDSCPTGTCPVGNCMNLSLAKPSSMILSSWKRYIHKKSTFFVRSSWSLVNIITTWDNHFLKVSWGLEKNCGFFINGQFLNMWYLFLLRPYFSIFFNIINFSHPFILMFGGCLKDALPGKHARSVQTWFDLEINLWFINAMLRAYYYQ